MPCSEFKKVIILILQIQICVTEYTDNKVKFELNDAVESETSGNNYQLADYWSPNSGYEKYQTAQEEVLKMFEICLKLLLNK